MPLIVATAVEGLLVIPGPGARDFAEFLGSDAGEGVLAGAWGWFAIIAVLVVFNTVLGEELLFRGYLLPRMNGRFGRRDWLANGVLFAGYHLHTPWVIPTTLLDTFILSYPSKRYRSALIGIAVHSAQSIVVLGLVLALVPQGADHPPDPLGRGVWGSPPILPGPPPLAKGNQNRARRACSAV